MLPTDSVVLPALLALAVALCGTLVTVGASTLYLQRVRLDRPAIGTFNGRDIAVLFGFVVFLPLLYVVLPLTPLLVALGITFVSAIVLGLRPLLGGSATWLLAGLLVGANIWLARTSLGTVTGWQIFWVENDLVVVIAAVTTANLYVQGGMRVRHVAWFATVLAVYDLLFTFVWPVTSELAQEFIGWPFDPTVGYRVGIYNATVGLGDLLAYSLFVIAILKAYGARAAWGALVVALVFGAVVPATLPLLTEAFIDARTDIIVPAQTAFGPAAFVYYRIVRRRLGPERSMAQFLAGRTAGAGRRAPLARPSSPSPGSAGGALAPVLTEVETR